MNGFNGTIFAYGQTSSGKTFTMEVLFFKFYDNLFFFFSNIFLIFFFNN